VCGRPVGAHSPTSKGHAQVDCRQLNRVHDDDGPNLSPGIVGLWHVIYTADDGSKFLESFKIEHADGTEFENAFLPPSAGNICFGVWKEVGHRSVKLHHVGLMFNPDGTMGSFTVDEVDTVSQDGRSYKGTFDFKAFDPAAISAPRSSSRLSQLASRSVDRISTGRRQPDLSWCSYAQTGARRRTKPNIRSGLRARQSRVRGRSSYVGTVLGEFRCKGGLKALPGLPLLSGVAGELFCSSIRFRMSFAAPVAAVFVLQLRDQPCATDHSTFPEDGCITSITV
jgi:hypothetical protein